MVDPSVGLLTTEQILHRLDTPSLCSGVSGDRPNIFKAKLIRTRPSPQLLYEPHSVAGDRCGKRTISFPVLMGFA
jgi:hypothetical protein